MKYRKNERVTGQIPALTFPGDLWQRKTEAVASVFLSCIFFIIKFYIMFFVIFFFFDLLSFSYL